MINYIRSFIELDCFFCRCSLATVIELQWSNISFILAQESLLELFVSTLKLGMAMFQWEWKFMAVKMVYKFFSIFISFSFHVAWESRQHFATPPTVSPRNDVWETSAEIPYWWHLWALLLIGRTACEICFNQSEGFSEVLFTKQMWSQDQGPNVFWLLSQ